MISTPDLRRRGARRALAAALAVLVTSGAVAEDLPADALVARAETVLRAGDAAGAAVYLERAMAAGRPRDAVAAAMGEALLAKGDLIAARQWLGPMRFARGSELRGLRALARLERREGRLGNAGLALDRALAVSPRDPGLWVDIARLRYAGGEQLQAIAAAERAVEYGPADPRALELRAELVRDQFGPLAALAWYERALQASTDDLDLLNGYAATLADLGRARDMLAATRRVLELAPGNPRALLLQATLAARGGAFPAARTLLDKAGGAVAEVPAALLLRGVIELGTGNPRAAQRPLVRLLELQPANPQAQMLYARALYESLEFAALVERLSTVADRPDAPVYLLTLIGRAHEAMGQREAAAAWLDRAAAPGAVPLAPLLPFDDPAKVAEAYRADPESLAPLVGYVRYLLVSGQAEAAEAAARRALARHPGSAQANGLLADALLQQGRGAEAVQHYGVAAQVRSDDALLVRMAGALERSAGAGSSASLIRSHVARHPESTVAPRLIANAAAARSDWGMAASVMSGLVGRGSGRDARLHADLALAQLENGDDAAALASAWRAYQLQGANGGASLALGLALARDGRQPALARALLAKAEALNGGSPVMDAARKRLGPS